MTDLLYLEPSATEIIRNLKAKEDAIRYKLDPADRNSWDNPEYKAARELREGIEQEFDELRGQSMQFYLDVQITPRVGFRDDGFSLEETIQYFERALEMSKAQVDAAQSSLEWIKTRHDAIDQTLQHLKKDRDAANESERMMRFDAEMKQKEQRRRQGIDETTLAIWKIVEHDQYDKKEENEIDEQIETFEMYGRLYLSKFGGRTNSYRIGWKWEQNYECFTNRKYRDHNSWLEIQRSNISWYLPDPSVSFKTYEEAHAAYMKKRNEMTQMAKEQLTKEMRGEKKE